MGTSDGHLLVHRITGGMIRKQGDRVLRHIRTTHERRLIEVGRSSMLASCRRIWSTA